VKDKSPVVFSLNNHPLAESLSNAIGGQPGEFNARQFPDGESYLRIQSDVENRACIVVADLSHPNIKYLPLLFLLETLRELGASQVGLVAPYLSYMRQDRRFVDGEAVTSRIFAKCLSQHADWLVTVDPHLHRYHSLDEIYSIPSRVVQGAPALAHWLKTQSNLLLVGPDSESEQWAGAIATHIGAPHAVFTKLRRGDRDVLIAASDLTVWRERTPILVDDVISSGQTLAHAAREITAQGFPAPICLAVHGLFAPGAEELLKAIGCRIVTTDSIAHPSNAVALGPLLGQALVRQLTVVDAKRLRRTPK